MPGRKKKDRAEGIRRGPVMRKNMIPKRNERIARHRLENWKLLRAFL